MKRLIFALGILCTIMMTGCALNSSKDESESQKDFQKNIIGTWELISMGGVKPEKMNQDVKLIFQFENDGIVKMYHLIFNDAKGTIVQGKYSVKGDNLTMTTERTITDKIVKLDERTLELDDDIDGAMIFRRMDRGAFNDYKAKIYNWDDRR